MLYVLLPKQRDLCVLHISTDVLQGTGVIVSDENAARGWARFEPWPDGLSMIEKEDIFRERWDVDDPFEKDRLKGLMCAEILVPDKVDSRFIQGAYVSCQESLDRLAGLCPGLSISLNKTLFFQ